MDKKTKIYLGLFLAIFALIVVAEMTKKQPLNWFPTYAAKHKIPYGTYILRTELSELLGGQEVTDIKRPPYEYLQDSMASGTYFFVNGEVNFDRDEFNKLLEFVARGNDVFISTQGCDIDTLGVKTQIIYGDNIEQEPFFKLLNKNLTTTEFSFDRYFHNTVFYKIDTLNTVMLGKSGYLNTSGTRSAEGYNFIKQSFGKGHFYFHTFPEAFTNYNILKDNNRNYTAAVLSYLDAEKPVLWDAWYKTGKTREIVSPMMYILKTKNLKYAYYVALIAILLYIIFGGKRKQRYIAVITPLKNQTLVFTQTIANMYYEKSEHKNIAKHRITHFLEFIRTKLHVPTVTINNQFYTFVALKSGKDEATVKSLFEYIKKIQQANTISKDELITLNKKIEDFKQNL
ncbi:MAG: hypothetical protein CSA39_02740 [Flavobacteriales bacterium]|nr:MAG: hypothetical protein CSA39_02740 [Flavobacteriales bacterium]